VAYAPGQERQSLSYTHDLGFDTEGTYLSLPEYSYFEGKRVLFVGVCPSILGRTQIRAQTEEYDIAFFSSVKTASAIPRSMTIYVPDPDLEVKKVLPNWFSTGRTLLGYYEYEFVGFRAGHRLPGYYDGESSAALAPIQLAPIVVDRSSKFATGHVCFMEKMKKRPEAPVWEWRYCYKKDDVVEVCYLPDTGEIDPRQIVWRDQRGNYGPITVRMWTRDLIKFVRPSQLQLGHQLYPIFFTETDLATFEPFHYVFAVLRTDITVMWTRIRQIIHDNSSQIQLLLNVEGNTIEQRDMLDEQRNVKLDSLVSEFSILLQTSSFEDAGPYVRPKGSGLHFIVAVTTRDKGPKRKKSRSKRKLPGQNIGQHDRDRRLQIQRVVAQLYYYRYHFSMSDRVKTIIRSLNIELSRLLAEDN